MNSFIQDKGNRMNVYGNIMSIEAGDGFESATTVTNGFVNLFMEWSGLISAENLLLPATTLTDSCYSNMFYGCTGLTQAPALPATTLAGSCYYGMFTYCASLTQAPALPATALAGSCYQSMFYGCTGLTQAPALPATALANGCYSNMFNGCTSLTSAPELPALTLAENSYSAMFYGCSSLNYIKCLATNIQENNCTDNWVYGVSGSGTFVKNPSMASWPSGDSGIPSGWTTQNG